jgi:hypothetical protein
MAIPTTLILSDRLGGRIVSAKGLNTEIAVKLSRMLLFSLLVIVTPALSSAQDATGRIYGTVYD